MADVITSTDSYAGQLRGAMFYNLMQGDGFSWKPYVYTYPNVDAKPVVLPSAEHDANPLLKGGTKLADLNLGSGNGSDITFKERKLTVTDLAYASSLDPEQWKQYFPDFQPTGNSLDLRLNPKVQKTAVELATNAISTQLARLHTIGDKSGGDTSLEFYDGFTTLIDADPDTTIVGTQAALTATNILEKVDALKREIPARLAFNPNLYAFCSKQAFELYHEARAKSQTYIPTPDVKVAGKLNLAVGSTLTLVPIEAMPRDFIFATVASNSPSSNLVQGFWSAGDDALRVIKKNNVDNDWLILMKMSTGVQYKSGKDIFYINKDAKP